MIDVALLSVIRRWHLREGISIREIARRTKLSRNTIRKYLAKGQVEPVYPKRKSPSKLDPHAGVLSSWLLREASRGRKQRRNLRQLYGDLLQLGYRGSYDRVAAFVRAWRQQRQEVARVSRGTYVPLRFAPGEAFQFDWSEDCMARIVPTILLHFLRPWRSDAGSGAMQEQLPKTGRSSVESG